MSVIQPYYEGANLAGHFAIDRCFDTLTDAQRYCDEHELGYAWSEEINKGNHKKIWELSKKHIAKNQKAFDEEYLALCEKYNLEIGYDVDYNITVVIKDENRLLKENSNG